jgi:Ran GTPase-activating protein (RanGAP) involved in mRNA processing and transport
MKIIVEKCLINKQCKRLWLSGNKITSIGASILASALNYNTSLERLYLHGNSISDIGVKYISKTLSFNNKTLKILGLQQNHITDLGAEHLAQMMKVNKTLTGLWLDNNQISDKGIKLISNALHNPYSAIEYIDYIIDIIKFNKSITEISLYDCTLSKTAKDKLKKASKLKKNFIIYLNSWNE